MTIQNSPLSSSAFAAMSRVDCQKYLQPLDAFNSFSRATSASASSSDQTISLIVILFSKLVRGVIVNADDSVYLGISFTHNSKLSNHRGRTASYPTAPAQIP